MRTPASPSSGPPQRSPRGPTGTSRGGIRTPGAASASPPATERKPRRANPLLSVPERGSGGGVVPAMPVAAGSDDEDIGSRAAAARPATGRAPAARGGKSRPGRGGGARAASPPSPAVALLDTSESAKSDDDIGIAAPVLQAPTTHGERERRKQRTQKPQPFDLRDAQASRAALATPLIPPDSPRAVDPAAPDANDAHVEMTWSTRLFKDAFSDWGVAWEVLLCHPCNVSAQFTAVLGPDPTAAAEEEKNSTSSASSGKQARGGRGGNTSSDSDDSSSDSDDEPNDHEGVSRRDQKQLAKMRQQLPPLNIVPCVGVIVLDTMCCCAGSMYFSYWIRNEVAHRFHLVPDVGHMATDDLYNSFASSSVSPGGSPRSGSGSPPRQIGRAVSRRRADDDDDANGDGDTTRPALLSKDGVKHRAKQAQDAAKANARKAAKATEKQLRKATKRATRTSVEFLQSRAYSALCFPCAMCQTMRELELRGFQPVRYLSSTRLAAQYATASIAGTTAATRML